jgi:hypothetical protein
MPDIALICGTNAEQGEHEIYVSERIRLRGWIGVRRILIPSVPKTSSNADTYLASRSRMRKRNGTVSQRATTLRACRVTHEALGFEVTPAKCTLRLAISMNRRT